MTRRWLFADQLGPHFLDEPGQPVLLIESKSVFRRRRFHRQKAHLLLSALRHRAAELGESAVLIRADTYSAALAQLGEPVSVCAPTSFAADRFVRSRPDVEVLPARGFVMDRADFRTWADGRAGKRLLMEDFYREQRRRTGLLMNGPQPAGGQWNLDHDNREPPPRRQRTLGLPGPWTAAEDEIDEQVRADLDAWEAEGSVTFAGADGPRWVAATREESLAALDRFITDRLAPFGPYEDAMLAADPVMSHSVLSAPMNLGLLNPLECASAAEQAYRAGTAPLNSVEGYVRQLIGWRDYIWQVYWYTGESYRSRNALEAHQAVPDWMWDLDPADVQARCLSDVLTGLRDRGWVHHIPRLMVLGNYALQRGVDPAELTAWFHTTFLDGYDWVMTANVVGMSQHADGGFMATKPYASGGAYIDRMSDYCGGCRYDPKVRIGPTACPFTAGYWAFLERNADRLRGNARMRQPLTGLGRLKDIEAVVEQERQRGTSPP